MATVKAMSTATVIDYTDVSNVKAWYLLVPRTSSAPTVSPTATETQMRNNGWGTIEPGVDTTKKLYKVDQCIFGDGTYVWGEVSLSSSYEAAIQAYNEAQAAKQTATNYIQTVTGDGIFVHSVEGGSSTSTGTGVHIGGAINIIKSGVSYIKAWISNNIPYIRIGREDKGNVLIDNDSVDIRDTSTTVASFGINGQYFCNDNGVSILEVGKLSQSTMTRLDWFIYDGVSSPFTVSLSWQVSSINRFDWYDISGRMQFIDSVGYTLNGRDITFDNATCEEMISKSIERFSVNYVAIGRFPYYTFGSAAVGSERIGDVGIFSFREGDNTVASGNASHAEGYDTIASGIRSHAEGSGSTAVGNYSHAEGYLSEANGDHSHAEGFMSKANGDYSHAQNSFTKTAYENQTAIGKYNANSVNNAFEIGNGTSDGTGRSNAFAVGWDGDVLAKGGINIAVEEIGSNYIRYSNGLQICWLNTNVNMSIDSKYGSSPLYTGTYTWTFPKAFSSAPSVMVGTVKWGTGASWGSANAATTTSVSIRGIDYFSRASGSTHIEAMAIGLWQ